MRDSEKRTHLEITITEGRNRQVRRMLEAVDSKVMKLVRTAIGPIRIGELPIGRWRNLSDDEVAALGGPTRAGRAEREMATAHGPRPSRDRSERPGEERRGASGTGRDGLAADRQRAGDRAPGREARPLAGSARAARNAGAAAAVAGQAESGERPAAASRDRSERREERGPQRTSQDRPERREVRAAATVARQPGIGEKSAEGRRQAGRSCGSRWSGREARPPKVDQSGSGRGGLAIAGGRDVRGRVGLDR